MRFIATAACCAVLTSCVESKARSEPSELDAARGNVIDGTAFTPTSGRAMARTGSGRGLLVELRETDVACHEAVPIDTVGARWLTLGTVGTQEPGRYEVKMFPSAEDDAFATVAVTVESANDERDGVIPRGTPLREGTVRIDAIGERVAGFADVGETEDDHFRGTFDVPYCP